MEKFIFIIYDAFDFSIKEVHLTEKKCTKRFKKLWKENPWLDWTAINLSNFNFEV